MFETKEKEVGAMPRCGYKKLGEKMVTKHDKEITQRENAKRIMEFPPGILTGDGGGFDMQVKSQGFRDHLPLGRQYAYGNPIGI